MQEYTLSDDIAVLIEKANAARDIRDLSIKLPFGYRKAFRAAHDARRFSTLFWRRVYNIYPELRGKKLEYFPETQTVQVFKDHPETGRQGNK